MLYGRCSQHIFFNLSDVVADRFYFASAVNFRSVLFSRAVGEEWVLQNLATTDTLKNVYSRFFLSRKVARDWRSREHACSTHASFTPFVLPRFLPFAHTLSTGSLPCARDPSMCDVD